MKLSFFYISKYAIFLICNGMAHGESSTYSILYTYSCLCLYPIAHFPLLCRMALAEFIPCNPTLVLLMTFLHANTTLSHKLLFSILFTLPFLSPCSCTLFLPSSFPSLHMPMPTRDFNLNFHNHSFIYIISTSSFFTPSNLHSSLLCLREAFPKLVIPSVILLL